MVSYPNIVQSNNSIEIIVSPYNEYTKHLDIELILDFNQFHDVVGIEILNLKIEAGEFCLEEVANVISSAKKGLSYSYDEESDSFYLRITDERSIDQEAVDGKLILDRKGQIVGFKAEFNG